jgi:hypothetical protein
MTILDYAYREVTISTIGAGGAGTHDNFSAGSIAKAIIDFCTDPQVGLKQIKFDSTYDFAVTQDRLAVADEIENSGTLSMTRPASGAITGFCVTGSTRKFALGELINVLTSANTGILPLGDATINSSGFNTAGSQDTDAFGVLTPAGANTVFNFSFTTATTRKVFALKQGAVTHVFSLPADETLFTLRPYKLSLTHKLLDTPYSPGSSRVNATIYPAESTSRSSPNTPTVVPVESVTNYLTRLSKLHCFKCEDAFYFSVEKTDGSFTHFAFGAGTKRGSWVGGEFSDGQFFDNRYMHKPAPGISHSPLFAGFCTGLDPLLLPNPYTQGGSGASSDGWAKCERFKTTKFRCLYPAARKGAKETVLTPPNARWAMSGDGGAGRDSAIAGATSGVLAWFSAVGAGTPTSSAISDGYVHAVVAGFTGIPGHILSSDLQGGGGLRTADPSVTSAPVGLLNNMPFGPDSTEIPAAINVGVSADGREDGGRRVAVRHLLFAGYGQNVASPNGWNNRVPGHEIEFFVKDYRTDEEASVARYLDAMVMPGIRVGNVRGFEAKEIVNSDWMTFPVTRLSDVLASNYDASSYPACYGLGYFIKKGVSI